ncbi:unnamed protein product [Arabis nemorensis]|uniref:ATP-dependent DNA ligase family profile domain-containing protein n=1 Tax=Arabis nemorensis TaxID=586526 RepID=A0A565CEI1_9BRAS|nr:unnamed protein product [Arabis nemorensis]
MSSTSDSPGDEIVVESKNEVIYKTKEIKFLGRKKRIILQNQNGPCPLIAICNVLILRDDLHPQFREVSQEILLTLVATTLIDFNTNVDREDDEYTENISDAISLLPLLADGINVNIKFKRINDFEFTPELAIFDLLNIPLYHGWIVNPQDLETATAIGCKSYNALMSALVALETQTVKSPSSQSSGECSVGFAEATTAALRIPSPCRSFAVSPPASAEHSRLRKGDIEEEIVLLQALRLSEREAPGLKIHRGSSSGEELDDNEMSKDAAAGCTSNICQQSKSDDQFSSTKSKDGNEINVGEKTNLESTKIDSSSEIKSEDSSGRSKGDDDKPPYEGDECGSLGSPFYKGESLLEKSSLEWRDTNELTPEEENFTMVEFSGELINKFLNNNRSQLTVTGLSYLQEQVKEDELCVFFRNNHFLTMLKYDGELYQLVTDQGYLTQQDLVWEKLNKVKGDSVFMTGDFKVFKSDEGKSRKWNQKHAISNTADYIFSINKSSSEEGMEIDTDLEMAMILQQQELAGDIYSEVSIRSNQRPSSMQEEVKPVVQRWLITRKETEKTLVPPILSSRVSQLKSRTGLLKKKPDDFDPETVGRTAITDILCNLLRTVMATTPEDLVPTVYLAANEIAPAHQGVKLGIGTDSIIKAISQAFGRTESHVKKLNTELGDLGLVAKGSRSSQTMIFMPKPLTVVKVTDTLRQIAKIIIAYWRESGKDCEPLYLTRLLEEKLRLGFSRQTVLAALGQADEDHSKPPPNTKNPLDEAAKIVKEVYSVLPDYDIIAASLLTSGVWNLPKTCTLTLSFPVLPMLAKAVTSLSLVLDKFEDTVFTCEYKYDGERAQIHYMEDGTFEIFSKHAERNTSKYPDVALALSSEVTLVCTCFYQKLYDSFDEDPGYFQFATALTSSNVGEIEQFLKASIDIGSIGDSVDKEEFQSICNIGSGFSEAELQELSSSLCSKVIATPKVWEVKAADLTISNIIIVQLSESWTLIRGFPRLVRVARGSNIIGSDC